MTDRRLHLSAAERARVVRIDALVASEPPRVDELLDTLTDSSWTVRRAAIAGLAALGDDAVVALCARIATQRTNEAAVAAMVDALAASIGASATSQVAELLRHPNPAVVEDAVRVIGRRHATELVGVVRDFVTHANDNVAMAAIESLGVIGGTAAIDALVGAIRSRNFFRTFPAMQVAARTGDPRVVAPIAELLADDSYRLEAARALGKTGSPLAIAPLAALLEQGGPSIMRLVAGACAELLARATWAGGDEHVAARMRDALAGMAARFAEALRGGDPAERAAIVRVLAVIGSASTLSVLEPLLDDPTLQPLALEAVRELARRDEAVVGSAFASADPLIRAAVLPMASTSRAAPTIRRLLADPDPEVRARACESIAGAGDTQAVPALFALLADPSPRVAHAATTAIHSLGSVATEALAIAALRDGDARVRRHALRIISYLGWPGAFDDVRATLADPDPRVAELAVAALAALADPRVDAELARVAREADEGLRVAAMRAGGTRDTEASRVLAVAGLADASPRVRAAACQALGRLNPPDAAALLVPRLADASPQVRLFAIEALARVATPESRLALRALVRSADPDERRAALLGIATHDDPSTVELLVEAAQDSDVATRLFAYAGLGRSHGRAALDQLARGLADPATEVSDAVLSLLAERDDRGATELLLELALEQELEHPVHAALSRPGAVRIAVIAEHLAQAGDATAPVLAAALARIRNGAATATLFSMLSVPNPSARRAAASSLIAIDADGARAAVGRLATHDPDPEVRRVCSAALKC
ncbi:MAG TPA: HEAT repeat domain-containing protein [Kofleriaceae bacterium]|jgi:HEAT repeat protein